ncbi:MAG TPA: hypothetical protein VFW39_11465 [Sphingomicrobium sp.]|nr:hypothetical protein [Sphingomicrobium sp.]
MVDNRLQDCREVEAAKGLSYATYIYQADRDAFNARMVEAMMNVTPHLVLWAHHSHLHYNSLGVEPPSIGQRLGEIRQPDLYRWSVRSWWNRDGQHASRQSLGTLHHTGTRSAHDPVGFAI